MGKFLLTKTTKGVNSFFSALAEFGKGAGYALRH